MSSTLPGIRPAALAVIAPILAAHQGRWTGYQMRPDSRQVPLAIAADLRAAGLASADPYVHALLSARSLSVTLAPDGVVTLHSVTHRLSAVLGVLAPRAGSTPVEELAASIAADRAQAAAMAADLDLPRSTRKELRAKLARTAHMTPKQEAERRLAEIEAQRQRDVAAWEARPSASYDWGSLRDLDW